MRRGICHQRNLRSQEIVQGSAKVIRDKDAWMIVAGPGTTLQFETQEVDQSKVLTK